MLSEHVDSYYDMGRERGLVIACASYGQSAGKLHNS